MKILIIADDLTGALDSSVAFCGRGLSVVCALAPAHVSTALAQNPDVLAISTNGREGTEEEAINAVASVWNACNRVGAWKEALLFKKVDSRLKGHVAAELSVLCSQRPKIVVTPAIPRLGRVVKSGAVCGAGISTPIPIAEKTGRPHREIVNGETDADLDRAIAGLTHDTLFVGAAGLAEALARKLAPARGKECQFNLAAPVLFSIGSRDPITLAQIDQLGGRHIPVLPAPNGIIMMPPGPLSGVHVLQLTEGTQILDGQTVTQCFAALSCKLVDAQETATLFASGGETAASVARGLGCGVLQVKGEVLPGLPVSSMVDGRPGMTVITKSGGFGSPETLVKLAEKFTAPLLESI